MPEDILTIFYDGHCPLCTLEMDKLKRYDKNNWIKLADLHQAGFSQRYPEVDFDKAMDILHGSYRGEMLLALDVTHRAWTLVGKGAFVAPLKFPVIRQVSHQIYLLLAKYRQPISQFLYQRFGIGSNTCKQGACYEKTNRGNYWRK